jgi:hypothetical protein
MFFEKMTGNQDIHFSNNKRSAPSTAVLVSPHSGPKASTRYIDQEVDVINMIVDKYCDKAEDGVQLLKNTGNNRR